MPLKTQLDEQPSLNLTPMIDVVFLLIIFFMAGTKFSELTESEQSLAINVPEVGKAGNLSTSPAKRVVAIHQDGHLELDGRALKLDALIAELKLAKQSQPKLRVVVRGDQKSSLQDAASVYSACREAGIVNVDLAVRERR